ncbi:MAG TPA: cytochrome c oxidase subunit II [Acidimicrobiia bacterium]|nr:cytochrome c oxidase subunit II [Acidimicrobiia bacterium]
MGESRVIFGSRRRRRVVIVLLLIAAALLLAACSGGDPTNLARVVDRAKPQSTLDPKGPNAAKIDDLYLMVIIVAAAVFVLVQGALLVAIFKFRQRKGQERPVRQMHGNMRLELVWTIIPVVILAIIAVPTLSTLFDLRSAPDPSENALQIEVTGHQWWWEFSYPEYGFTTAGELHIPVDRPVYLTMTSADVIHSFWVPPLNGKRDVVPGRISNLLLQADDPGVYTGQCAEFCGLAHADMRIRLFAETPADFESWALAQAQPAVIPTTGPAAAGWETFSTICIACHAVEGTNAQIRIAPDLTHLASRTSFAGATIDNTPENLKAWLHDPSALKPMRPDLNKPSQGRIMGMPNFHLTDQQIDDLIALLETFQ